MKGFIVQPTYRLHEGKPQVLLFGRLENGESFLTINDYQPYFHIKEDDKQKAEKILEDIKAKDIDIVESDFKDFDDNKVVKITLTTPREISELKSVFHKENITCYEADLRYPYMFLIDNNIKGCIEIEGEKEKDDEYRVDNLYINPKITPTIYTPELKTLSIDIETDMQGTNVFAISLYSKDIEKVLFLKEGQFNKAECFKDEKSLLEAFAKEILKYDPDVITGWNLIDFDFDFLNKRFKHYNIPFILGRTNQECRLNITTSFFTSSKAYFPGRAVLDAMDLMKVSFMKLADYKLNTAAKTILGEEKLLTGEGRHEDIELLYKEDPQKLVDYNLKDSELVYKILEKTNILNLTIRRTMLTRMQLDRVNASIASFDSLYLEELKKRKVVAPSAFANESSERIKGGFVMKSQPGIYDGIIVLDFKSLYPSIIRTFNIDPFSFVPIEKYETLSEDEQKVLIEAPNKAHFKNQDGILPMIIERLWQERDKAKKENDQSASLAIKITMNSFFGVLANPTCRFYSLEMANGITHFGQFLNKLTAKKIEEKGYEVIYGDTDSVFVNTNDVENMDKIGLELQTYINDFYTEYIKQYNRPSFIELEFEKAFHKFLMPKVRGSEVGAKKRYAGLVKKDGKEEIKVVGLEIVRRDWTDLAKKFQMELLEHIFHDKPIDSYIKNFVQELKDGKMDDLIVYRKAIRKLVSEYTKTTPPHIKAARKAGIKGPGLIEYYMTLNGPEITEKNSSKIDYEHYIEKQIKPLADSVLSFQDKNFDDLVAKHKQMDLSSF